MPLSIPEYVKITGVTENPIQHVWNESVKDDVLTNQPQLMDALSGISYRGLLALSLGSVEWTVWRLVKHLPDQSLLQLIEATWAATIDWRYLKSFDVPDWLGDLPGPISGPLDTGIWLLKESFVAARDLEPFRDSVAALCAIPVHVLVRAEPYKEWRRFAIGRLAELHPRRQENRLGDPVPREALDPSCEYNISTAKELLARFLKALDHKHNHYLRSPGEMLEAGFKGAPYSL